MKFFSAKNFLHEEHSQLERQKRALGLKMNSVDRENQSGTIKDYNVTLDGCTCVDFQKKRKPCKHMYRLAFELGVFNMDAEKIDALLVATPKTVNAFYSPEISFYSAVPKKFVVIDFETANKFKDSICQMGVAVVENDSITERKNFFIRPPYENFTNTKIHGITFDDVKNFPTFAELWPEIKIFIEGQIVAAYYVPFDMSCLVSTLKFYQLPVPNFAVFDIWENVRDCSEYHDCELSYTSSYKLVDVAETLDFAHDAHDALSDAVVAAQIQLWITKNFPREGTLISCTSILTLVECFARENISLETVVSFCKHLLKSGDKFSMNKREEFFKLLEAEAARRENAALYKLCGKFYDGRDEILRALELYRRAFALDSKSGVKTRIQTLERALRKTSANQK